MANTEAALPTLAPAPAALRQRTLIGDAWLRFRANRAAVVSLAVILVLAFVALFAELIAPYGPSDQFLTPPDEHAPRDPLAPRDTGKYEGPTRDHVFGTDHLARDIFSRLVIGLRISLAAALFAVVVVTVIGLLVGSLAVAGPPIADRLLMRVTDAAFAFPDLLLIILLRSAFGDEIFGFQTVLGLDADVLLLFFAISFTFWPTMARLVRGQLLSIRETEYTQAAIALGASRSRIVLRHWLPNAMGPVIVEATFVVPQAIFAEAALSFIGLGIGAPTPSIGILIDEHLRSIAISWSGLLFPIALLALLFVAFSFLGDGLRDALDPRSTR